MKLLVAAALVAVSPPRLCPPRAAGISLAASEGDVARARGRQGHAVALQNIIDRGEAATLEEAQTVLSRRGYAAGLQNIMDRGEATTLVEAQVVKARQGRKAQLQSLVDNGKAVTLEEASKLTGVHMRATALQNMVDSGEAATLEEAQQVLSQRGHMTSLQNIVDRGEAATMKEAQQLLSHRGHLTSLQRIIDRGEAATMEEAQQVLSRSGREAFDAKYSYEECANMQSAVGVNVAKQKGFRTNYPGVRWQKKQDRKTGKTLDEGTGAFPETSRGFWRVSFKYKGKMVSVGSGYADEVAAAHAHDEYVRKHNLQRRLHFPRPQDEK